MNILTIDKGNSRTKVGLHQKDGVIEMAVFANNADDELLHHIEKLTFDSSIMSSVSAANLKMVSDYLLTKGNFLMVNSQTKLPLKNKYATPETLGTDRLAGAVGAWTLQGKNNILLIDAGTCVNYECVVNNEYLGGAISPGLEMRLKAMHDYTGKLPLFSLPDEPVSWIGSTTESCMLAGALMGLVNEIEGFANQYKAKYAGISVVLSGGDGPFLGKYLKNSIFAPHQEVVLVGLVEILKFNLNA